MEIIQIGVCIWGTRRKVSSFNFVTFPSQDKMMQKPAHAACFDAVSQFSTDQDSNKESALSVTLQHFCGSSWSLHTGREWFLHFPWAAGGSESPHRWIWHPTTGLTFPMGGFDVHHWRFWRYPRAVLTFLICGSWGMWKIYGWRWPIIPVLFSSLHLPFSSPRYVSYFLIFFICLLL